jgi:hypothetical protein
VAGIGEPEAATPSSSVTLADALTAVRFLVRIPALVRRPLDLEAARRAVAIRQAGRTEQFLARLRDVTDGPPGTPYATLLRHAGCSPGDVERLVRADGVEGAARALYRAGVYLTIDEFKGRRPAVRGSLTLHVTPEQLRNRRSALHVQARSSGSRGTGTPVVFDLAFIRGCAAATALFLEARGGLAWDQADWETPGGGSLFRLLKVASLGRRPARWFTQVHVATPGLHPRYRWSARLLRVASRLSGAEFPPPEHVSLEDPTPIAAWMRGLLDRGTVPHLFTFASSAVRVCQTALAAGIDLSGAQFTLIGEPVTGARLAMVRRTGAAGLPRYGTIECGPIGYGCPLGSAPDDIHVLSDLQVVVQPGPDADRPEVPARALLVTSLHPASPFTLLNVAMGDVGTLGPRACGCPLAERWPLHLEAIRSYEKLTAGGMNFLDIDVVRVLEEILPARFGGAPTDYQLVEREDADGRSGLGLIAHPRLGPLDPGELARVFLSAVSEGSGAERVMSLAWREAGLLRVERREPLATRSGKILHLHAPGDASPRPRSS